MKALVKKHPERGLWFEDVPEPATGVNDVKIKIHFQNTGPITLIEITSCFQCTHSNFFGIITDVQIGFQLF